MTVVITKTQIIHYPAYNYLITYGTVGHKFSTSTMKIRKFECRCSFLVLTLQKKFKKSFDFHMVSSFNTDPDSMEFWSGSAPDPNRHEKQDLDPNIVSWDPQRYYDQWMNEWNCSNLNWYYWPPYRRTVSTYAHIFYAPFLMM